MPYSIYESRRVERASSTHRRRSFMKALKRFRDEVEKYHLQELEKQGLRRECHEVQGIDVSEGYIHVCWLCDDTYGSKTLVYKYRIDRFLKTSRLTQDEIPSMSS